MMSCTILWGWLLRRCASTREKSHEMVVGGGGAHTRKHTSGPIIDPTRPFIDKEPRYQWHGQWSTATWDSSHIFLMFAAVRLPCARLCRLVLTSRWAVYQCWHIPVLPTYCQGCTVSSSHCLPLYLSKETPLSRLVLGLELVCHHYSI